MLIGQSQGWGLACVDTSFLMVILTSRQDCSQWFGRDVYNLLSPSISGQKLHFTRGQTAHIGVVPALEKVGFQEKPLQSTTGL